VTIIVLFAEGVAGGPLSLRPREKGYSTVVFFGESRDNAVIFEFYMFYFY
jgi:hypothetical protein